MSDPRSAGRPRSPVGRLLGKLTALPEDLLIQLDNLSPRFVENLEHHYSQQARNLSYTAVSVLTAAAGYAGTQGITTVRGVTALGVGVVAAELFYTRSRTWGRKAQEAKRLLFSLVPREHANTPIREIPSRD